MITQPIVISFDETGLSDGAPKLAEKRALSAMKGMFLDETARAAMDQDTVVYEFHTLQTPELATDLAFGISTCYPGKVGGEYFMTKGHYHEIFDCAEVYICRQGRGIILMETPDGQWSAPELMPGQAVYVPGGWAHRSVNIGDEPFVTFFCFRADAGHDYGTIEQKGFRKLVMERDGEAVIVDNPCM